MWRDVVALCEGENGLGARNASVNVLDSSIAVADRMSSHAVVCSGVGVGGVRCLIVMVSVGCEL
jgi:hypothetical protein